MKHPCNDYAFFHVLISFNTKQVLLESFLWDGKHQKWREIPGVLLPLRFNPWSENEDSTGLSAQQKEKKKLNKIKKKWFMLGRMLF